jgi:hypothetical protein
MSEPRYPTRVSDPDETARIPKDALEALRDADQGKDGKPTGASAGSQPAAPNRPADGRPNGSAPAQRPGGPNSGATPAAGQDSRPSGFRPASGSNGSGVPSAGGSGPAGHGPSSGPAGPGASSGTNGSITGYRRSDYAPPTAYSGGYGSPGFSTLGDAPTTVTGPGGPGAAAAGNAAAARSALSAATRPARPSSSGPRPARRARLLVRHIDPWSTLKFSFVLAVAMFFVWLVAIGVLYGVLDGMGVFEQINGLYDEVSGNGGDSLFSPGLVLGTAALVGVVNIVLFTALATIGSFVYNICSDLVGGIEITLAEKD